MMLSVVGAKYISRLEARAWHLRLVRPGLLGESHEQWVKSQGEEGDMMLEESVRGYDVIIFPDNAHLLF
jgi:hypothetical protein